MTKDEAKARAQAIWGKHRYQLEPLGGGWWVYWREADEHHYIDAQGQTHCHKACLDLEGRDHL